MNAPGKDTIYIDVDDEITSIIEKVRNSPMKVVALVLPKRASMLQSIVNLKLLKRTGDDAGKNLVLITSETSLLPLVGAVGLHVAKTPQSKPEIPPPPPSGDDLENTGEVELDPTKPVGELAGLPPLGGGDEEAIEVDNSDPETSPPGSLPTKSDQKLKVPNFNKFRARLFLGLAALVLLAGGWYLAVHVLPSAHITIQTSTTSISSDIPFTARPNQESVNLEQSLLPAKLQEVRRTDTEKTAATGQRDLGKRASGQVELRNCRQLDGAVTIPAGTGISTGNLTYITNEAVTLPPSLFSGGGACVTPTRSVGITAQHPGPQYNLAAGRDFAVNGHPRITGENTSDITGGTSEIVRVVRQEDVDGAKTRLMERHSGDAAGELKSKLRAAGLFAVEVTMKTGEPTVVTSPNVGDQADEVTVTSTVVYTMLGVREDDLKKLVEQDVRDDIDPAKQSILDHGLSQAVFRLLSHEANGDARVTFQPLVVAGPQLDENSLRREIRGKSKTETVGIIKNRPGIRGVTVDYSPFWVFQTPRKEDRINFTIKKLDESGNADTGSPGE